jgi:hypothetical protein
MSKRIFMAKGQTFNAAADGSALTAVIFMYIQASATAPQLVDVLECKVSGMQTASTLAGFQLHRASTNATTPTALSTASASDGLMLPTGTALSTTVVVAIAAGTGPTGSNVVTDAVLDLSLNGFGGILRWNAAPTQEWKIQGTAAPGQASVLYNSSTAGGTNCAANTHIIYEPY